MNLFKKKPPLVKCDECHCILEEKDAQHVESFEGVICEFFRSTKYYCGEHKKPYKKFVLREHSGDHRFYGEVEVSEDGTPVGYKKIKKRQTS